jgi:hypothetical protein
MTRCRSRGEPKIAPGSPLTLGCEMKLRYCSEIDSGSVRSKSLAPSGITNRAWSEKSFLSLEHEIFLTLAAIYRIRGCFPEHWLFVKRTRSWLDWLIQRELPSLAPVFQSPQ